MTVAAEIAKRASRLNYFLCVEGIGWPTDESDLTQGFSGDVFATNDADGDLASILGCTVHFGLGLPGGISDQFDPRTMRYEHGSVSFSIQDVDAKLQATLTNHITGDSEDTLTTALAYNVTSVLTTSNTFSENDVVWLGGREAVKLGSISGAGPYTYSSCTRGYLGTPQGRLENRPTGLDAFKWAVSTKVRQNCRVWYDRKTVLFVIVPGETVGNAVRLYNGRLRGWTIGDQGITYNISTVHDTLRVTRTTRENPTKNYASFNAFFIASDNRIFPGGGQPDPNSAGAGTVVSGPQELPDGALSGAHRLIEIEPRSRDAWEFYALGYHYLYRNRTPGGTDGVRTAIDADETAPQALQDGKSRHMIYGLLNVGGNYVRALYKRADNPIAVGFRSVVTQGAAFNLGNNFNSVFEPDAPIRFMLDNYLDEYDRSWFAINNQVTRNPVDVLLMFLTSTSNEFWRGDSTTGGTTTTFEATSPGWTADEWIGYALHSVEQSNTLGESRVITDNDADTLTLGTAFSNATANTNEYQIRNTIYDILPLGWGLGIHNSQIDLDTFEAVRDEFLSDATLGRFALGDADKIDLLDLITDNILVPYGIQLYVSRSTGKLSARFIGEVTAQSGLTESYVAITANDILAMGDIDMSPQAPVGKIELKVRDGKTVSIKPITRQRPNFPLYPETVGYEEQDVAEPSINGKSVTIEIRSDELDSALVETKTEKLTVNAMFNSEWDCEYLVSNMVARLKHNSRPPPRVDITVDISFLTSIEAGTLLDITDNNRWNPINPFTGARGWTNVVARCLGTRLNLSDNNPSVTLSCELLSTVTGAKVAPAVLVTAKGSDGGGDYFTVTTNGAAFSGTNTYVIDPDGYDWAGFQVGDYLQVRGSDGSANANGSGKDNFGTIASFGSNQSNDTDGADSARIYVSGTIPAGLTISAGDYLTFDYWDENNTTNMDAYCGLADASEDLGPGNDDAKKYL